MDQTRLIAYVHDLGQEIMNDHKDGIDHLSIDSSVDYASVTFSDGNNFTIRITTNSHTPLFSEIKIHHSRYRWQEWINWGAALNDDDFDWSRHQENVRHDIYSLIDGTVAYSIAFFNGSLRISNFTHRNPREILEESLRDDLIIIHILRWGQPAHIISPDMHKQLKNTYSSNVGDQLL